MKKVHSKTVKPGDLSHELMLLQQCGYIIDNVFQNHNENSYNGIKETYTIIYERDE